PIDLREDAASGGRVQRSQLLDVSRVRIEMRGAGPPQGREECRGDEPDALRFDGPAPAGQQSRFEVRRGAVDGALVTLGHKVPPCRDSLRRFVEAAVDLHLALTVEL